MIYFDLILGFLKVGCFAFGGAYGAIPLIRDVVLNYGWLTDEELTYMIAVSESTPGPIMVNLATYIGSTQAGLPGEYPGYAGGGSAVVSHYSADHGDPGNGDPASVCSGDASRAEALHYWNHSGYRAVHDSGTLLCGTST